MSGNNSYMNGVDRNRKGIKHNIIVDKITFLLTNEIRTFDNYSCLNIVLYDNY